MQHCTYVSTIEQVKNVDTENSRQSTAILSTKLAFLSAATSKYQHNVQLGMYYVYPVNPPNSSVHKFIENELWDLTSIHCAANTLSLICMHGFAIKHESTHLHRDENRDQRREHQEQQYQNAEYGPHTKCCMTTSETLDGAIIVPHLSVKRETIMCVCV